MWLWCRQAVLRKTAHDVDGFGLRRADPAQNTQTPLLRFRGYQTPTPPSCVAWRGENAL